VCDGWKRSTFKRERQLKSTYDVQLKYEYMEVIMACPLLGAILKVDCVERHCRYYEDDICTFYVHAERARQEKVKEREERKHGKQV